MGMILIYVFDFVHYMFGASKGLGGFLGLTELKEKWGKVGKVCGLHVLIETSNVHGQTKC